MTRTELQTLIARYGPGARLADVEVAERRRAAAAEVVRRLTAGERLAEGR